MDYQELTRQIQAYKKGKCKYTWDELEEIATNSFDDGAITSEEFDTFMESLMAMDAREEETFVPDKNFEY